MERSRMLRRLAVPALIALSMLALPAPVSATDYLVASTFDAGGHHSCALTRTGEAFCWGQDGYGQLGDGATISSDERGPRQVIGGLRFRSLSVGGYTTCGITRDGAAYCWGYNEYGQLGDGTTDNSDALGPRPVIGGHRWRSISTDEYHTCGITLAGRAYCWGDNGSGQLGDGTTDMSGEDGPRPVIGGLRFRTIDVDLETTCALTVRGEAYCWGANSYGQLGDGTTSSSDASGPQRVMGAMRWESITAGYFHTCGVTVDGRGFCWGYNGDGELGDGTTSISGVHGPQPVIGGLRFSSIDLGYLFSCGLERSTGLAYCWGYNYSGQLGDGTVTATGVGGPIPVLGGLRFVSLRTGWYHVCGLTREGAMYCWGLDVDGQLGDGTTVVDNTPSTPVRVIAGQA